jgi:hypothetical protein
MGDWNVREPIPEEVEERLGEPTRAPAQEPTLGIEVQRPVREAPARHRLVTVGDSLTHGFQSGAIFNTGLSYPALIARELGWYDEFRHPSYDGYGGLPLNIEYLLRELEGRFGDRLDWHELGWAALAIRSEMARIEDWWERDAEQAGRFATINHNLGIYGWDLFDARTRTAESCNEDIDEPTDALFKQVVSNANERAALRVLAPGPPGQEKRTPLQSAAALGDDGGIETLIVMLGANNALPTVVSLKVAWSQDEGYRDPKRKGEYTVWQPHHFRAELDEVAAEVRQIDADHVIWCTVPHVTIAPVARGIGDKLEPGSRYFPHYARPWVESFDPGRHTHITGDEARAVDAAIDLYNEAIEALVAQGRRDGRDWRLLDLAGLLDRLAVRRYIADPSARPDWWTPYPLPAALQALSPVPDSRFFASGPKGRSAGGLFSLDGVHPTTIAYGLMAQELIRIMEGAGVVFRSPAGDERRRPVTIDFEELIRLDSLISDPPRSLSPNLSLIERVDSGYGWLRRMLISGP